MPPLMRREARVPRFPSPIATPTATHHKHHLTTTTTTTTTSTSTSQTRNRRIPADAEAIPTLRAGPHTTSTLPSKFSTMTMITSEPLELLPGQMKAVSVSPTVVPQILTSKMNHLHVPDPPVWFVWFLACLLVCLFLFAGLLAVVTFPPWRGGGLLGLRVWMRDFGEWGFRLGRRGKGRYRAVFSDVEDDDDDEVDRFLPYLELEGGEEGHTSFTPELERKMRVRKRNFKDLRIDTSVAASSTRREVEGLRIRVGGGGGSEEEGLVVGRAQEVRRKYGGGIEGSIPAVEKGIENFAGWVGGLLIGEAVGRGGAEEGLLFGVRDCEREGVRR